MQTLFNILGIVRRGVRELGPYLMLELLLPGGTLLALTLFLYRSGRLNVGDPRKVLALSIAAIARRR
ncbi:MAG TPA: hypothetical protein VLQ46_04655 [Casimicrobiaceae bacterium]|nr:hypothetical protein [Casimicrobiaceae bacterium]